MARARALGFDSQQLPAFHFSLTANIISVLFFLALVHAADSTADVAMVFKDHGRICD